MDTVIVFGLSILLAAVVLVCVVCAHKYAKRKQREEEQQLAERKKMTDEYLRKWRQSSDKQSFDTYASKVTNTKPAASSGASIKPPPAPRTKMEDRAMPAPPSRSYTTSDSSDDGGFLTGMLVGATLNTIMSGSGRSSEATEERSVGVSKSESSWGFDDADSRSSISSSMDTSSSWGSSSSSDSWSSSDSGPSSDW